MLKSTKRQLIPANSARQLYLSPTMAVVEATTASAVDTMERYTIAAHPSVAVAGRTFASARDEIRRGSLKFDNLTDALVRSYYPDTLVVVLVVVIGFLAVTMSY